MATAIKEKAAAAYAAEKAETDKDIAAIAKYVAALERGMAGAFLQTDAAQSLELHDAILGAPLWTGTSL